MALSEKELAEVLEIQALASKYVALAEEHKLAGEDAPYLLQMKKILGLKLTQNIDDPDLIQLKKNCLSCEEKFNAAYAEILLLVERLEINDEITNKIKTLKELASAEQNEIIKYSEGLVKHYKGNTSDNFYMEERKALSQRNLKINLCLKKIYSIDNFHKSSPLREFEKNQIVNIASGLTDKKYVLEEKKAAASGDELTELNDQIDRITNYQNNLIALVTNTSITIEYADTLLDKEGNIVDGLPFFNAETLEIGIKVTRHKNPIRVSALVAHELQHLLQTKEGKLGILIEGKNTEYTFGVLYDLIDEVEAYQIQFIICPESVPGYPKLIQKYNDINASYIKTIPNYSKLPEKDYNDTMTLEELSSHPLFGENLKANFSTENWEKIKKHTLHDKIFNGLDIETAKDFFKIKIK